MHNNFAIAFVFLSSVLVGICGAATDHDGGRNTTSAWANEVDGYRLGPQDLLDVEVFRVAELSRTVRVDSAGHIALPLIGSIKAAGRTAQELESAIAAHLGQSYLQDPYVSVFIKEYTSQRVTVEGAVHKPGIYALKGRTTLLQAIAMAQGITDLADAERVQIFRSHNDGSKAHHDFDIRAIRKGDVHDPVVTNDDVIVVNRAAGRSFIKGVTDTLRGFIGFGQVPY